MNRWTASVTSTVPVALLGLAVLAGCGTRPRPATAGSQATLLVYAADCDANHGAACYELGEVYASGDGTPRDPKRALPLLRRACELDYEGACDQVAQMDLGRAPSAAGAGNSVTDADRRARHVGATGRGGGRAGRLTAY